MRYCTNCSDWLWASSLLYLVWYYSYCLVIHFGIFTKMVKFNHLCLWGLWGLISLLFFFFLHCLVLVLVLGYWSTKIVVHDQFAIVTNQKECVKSHREHNNRLCSLNCVNHVQIAKLDSQDITFSTIPSSKGNTVLYPCLFVVWDSCSQQFTEHCLHYQMAITTKRNCPW